MRASNGPNPGSRLKLDCIARPRAYDRLSKSKDDYGQANGLMLTANVNIPKAVGHALVIASNGCREESRQALAGIGYEIDECDEPYAALIELCRRPLVYRAIVVSLQCLYPEELTLISTVRRHFPHVSIWLAHTDGRQASLVEAMRLGAEALIDRDGIHTFAEPAQAMHEPKQMTFRPVPSQEHEAPEPLPARNSANDHDARAAEPVLTAAELRALLGDQCV